MQAGSTVWDATLESLRRVPWRRWPLREHLSLYLVPALLLPLLLPLLVLLFLLALLHDLLALQHPRHSLRASHYRVRSSI